MRNKSRIAGILIIVSGVFGFLFLALMILQQTIFRAMFSQSFAPGFPSQEFLRMIMLINIIYGIGYGIPGTFAVIAGILTLEKRYWSLALAGAIVSCVIFYPCGIPAVLLVSFAREEFTSSRPLDRQGASA